MILRACPLLATGHCAKEDQVLGVPGDHREGEQRGGRLVLGTQLPVLVNLVWFLFFYSKNWQFFKPILALIFKTRHETNAAFFY